MFVKICYTASETKEPVQALFRPPRQKAGAAHRWWRCSAPPVPRLQDPRSQRNALRAAALCVRMRDVRPKGREERGMDDSMVRKDAAVYDSVRGALEAARKKAAVAVNDAMVEAY